MTDDADSAVTFHVVPGGRAAGPRPAAPPRNPDPEPLWREILGERLRELRHDRAESLGQTAARAGISPQYLSEVERGLKEPSSEMIAAVAGALDTTLGGLAESVADELRIRREASQALRLDLAVRRIAHGPVALALAA